VAEWFKAAVLKTARGFTLPRGFESHPFRQESMYPIGNTLAGTEYLLLSKGSGSVACGETGR
jgi:hypothetical protein